MLTFSTPNPPFDSTLRKGGPLLKSSSLRIKGGIAVAAILIQFFVFKQFYPFASFFQDSYTYINAAAEGDSISYRPIGYSWFLILIHFITSSDTFLVFVQYCFLQAAGLYLYFSIVRLYSPRKIVGNIVFYFLLLNPVNLYIANVVSSDALFISLSLIWLTQLLWLIHRPSSVRLVSQLVLLILIFYIRYNALCYPVMAAAAFLLTRKGWGFKLTGIISSILALVLGVALIGQLTRQQTGVRLFSAFSGWQIANNALYVYPYVTVDSNQLPSPECRELDRMVKAYFAASPHGHLPVDTWYMWNLESPLKKYLYRRVDREHLDYFTAWNKVAPVYSKYGYYLLIHHPLIFSREYGLPSAQTFFYPSLEMLLQYNEGLKEVDPVAKSWFHYKSTHIKVSSYTAQGSILAPLPGLYLFVNIAFVGVCLLILLSNRGRRKWRAGAGGGFRGALLLTCTYFAVNAAFCIFATPNMMRYQLAPFVWLFIFTLLAYDWPFTRWNPGPVAPME